MDKGAAKAERGTPAPRGVTNVTTNLWNFCSKFLYFRI